MFKSGDILLETATGRKGQVAEAGTVGSSVTSFTVQFQDGKQPFIKEINDTREWQLVMRPGEGTPPGLVPERWVV